MADLRTRSLPAPLAGDPTVIVGTVLDAWRIDALLACGGFGAVYRAVSTATGATAALKLLHPHLVTTQLVARLEREAAVLGTLRHPGIVPLLDQGRAADGRPYLVMELLAGVDLATSIDERGPRAAAEALAIIEPLADALAAVHAHGIVHRDLKASNVFLAADRVVLLDFGISKVHGAAPLTTARQRIGTPACMSPEQIRGEPVDERTDVYGLGALTYHLLTGRVPFDDPSPTLSQYRHLHARRPRASTLAPLVRRVDDVLARAMAVDPSVRFPSAPAFAAALRAAVTADDAPETLVDAVAIRVAIDAALAATPLDVDTALLWAERTLGGLGLDLAVEHGDSAVFTSATLDVAAAARAATTLYHALLASPVRVPVAISLDRGLLLVAGDEPRGGELLDPTRWACVRAVHRYRPPR